MSFYRTLLAAVAAVAIATPVFADDTAAPASSDQSAAPAAAQTTDQSATDNSAQHRPVSCSSCFRYISFF